MKWFFLLFSLLLAACGSGGQIKPPDIAYGRDLCARCGMVIDDPRYAAALLLENNQSLKFDDVGEMFKWHAEHMDQAIRAWFVHDYQSQGWLRAETSFYVVSKGIKSPMGAGVIAFGERATADTFARNQSPSLGVGSDTGVKVYTFEQALAEVPALMKH
ncbi:MAG: nitrous oxide reductase accessory protein NosL [Chloroflexi bacterium]|nr:nitrous oxide reductase accessory protein NosL [Chloroflexota bacterium]MCL5275080.1 nitrous oxide reductase accessory protein NosL [Chloroflexota bacterium]